MRYEFYDPTIPSLSDIVQKLANDPAIPGKVLELIETTLQEFIEASHAVARFATLQLETVPCTGDVLSGLLRELQAHDLSSRVPLGHACWGVLKQYDLSYPTRWAPFNANVGQLANLVPTGYRRRDLERVLRLGATGHIDLYRFNEKSAEVLLRALERDPAVQHPDTVWLNTMRGWSWAVKNISEWPQQLVTVPRNREVWGLRWSQFPTGLGGQAERVVENDFVFLPPGSRAAKKAGRTASTKIDYVEYLRMGASELVHSGVDPATITDLRMLFTPNNFGRILNGMRDRAGGKPTRLVRTKVRALHSIGRSAGLISDSDCAVIEALAADISARAKKHANLNPSRIQKGVDEITAQERDKALIGPIDYFSGAMPTMRTRSDASRLKRALVSAMRSEAPLPLDLIRLVRLDHLTMEVDADGLATYHLHIPAEETGTWVTRDYDFSVEVSRLIEMFINGARNKLGGQSSVYLLPGMKGNPQTLISLSSQVNGYLSDLLQRPITSAVITAANDKRILIEVPGGIEAVRAARGHKSGVMVRRAAERFAKPERARQGVVLVASGRLSAKKGTI